MYVFPSGLLLASGGEFAFVAFGEAVSKGVLPAALISQLYLVVALSMALTPYLAAIGESCNEGYFKLAVEGYFELAVDIQTSVHLPSAMLWEKSCGCLCAHLAS